ncbi:uncharacterized protein LOC129738090 [Uranotaenia lowii]|uniref:uncharacterized protein LOC129738090 n=1 Tax=Uranotaenia lowii TaxID=190385 RepID=UPI002479CE48|nr:uncharacterized protein LOC129738090 [Uranotaenia lowii]
MKSIQGMVVIFTIFGIIISLSNNSSAEQYEDIECNLIEEENEKDSPTTEGAEATTLVEESLEEDHGTEADGEEEHEIPVDVENGADEADETKEDAPEEHEAGKPEETDSDKPADALAQELQQEKNGIPTTTSKPKPTTVSRSSKDKQTSTTGGKTNGSLTPKGSRTNAPKGPPAGKEGPTEKPDPMTTYLKTTEAVDDAIEKTDAIKDRYLKSEVKNLLQAYLKNPLISVVSSIGSFAKVEPCLADLENDVGKIVTEADKAFNECMADNSSSHTACIDESKTDAYGEVVDVYSSAADCVQTEEDAQQGGNSTERPNPQNTHRKVTSSVDKAFRKLKAIKNRNLRSTVKNHLDSYLKNPLIDQANYIPVFSKIEPCLADLQDQIAKLADEIDKGFNECAGDSANSETHCIEDATSKLYREVSKLYNSKSLCFQTNQN